jgi:uncharacterized protein DUF7021
MMSSASDRGNASTRRIVGVVTPMGASAGRTRPAADWTLRFSLQPWRHEGEALNDTELVITKVVSDTECKQTRALIRPNDVLEVEVAHEFSATASGARGVLISLLGLRSDDADFHAAAKKLQDPVYLEDAQFGRLVLNRRSNDWNGSALRGLQRVRLIIGRNKGDGATTSAALEVAKALWRDRREWEARLLDMPSRELLP